MNALAEAATRPEYRGRYPVAFQMTFTVAALIAPAVVGLSAHGAGLPWLVVALASAIAAATYPTLGRRLPERSPPTTAPIH